MYIPADQQSRRRFLHQVSVGVAAAGVAGMWEFDGGNAVATHVHQADPCAPPAHGTARPFIRDCRPIRPRQIANRLTPAEVAQLKAAYQAMRNLDVSDPSDPRGFTQQKNIHCFHCADAPADQMHYTWKFLAWHRAYLYFHERILGKLIGNENFRLSYWGWDNAAFRTIPTPYVTPNDSTNPLFNSSRKLAPGDNCMAEHITDEVITDTLNISGTSDFIGTSTTSGIPEGTPHAPPHIDTGGDMMYFASAANDPVFYAHHGTLDKVWSDWNKSAATHTNPTDTAYRDLTFTFFDENKVWRSIKASQVLDHENSLRYVYEPYRFWDRFPCLIWRPFPSRPATKLSIAANPALADALKSNAPVRLNIRGMEVPRDRSTMYRIYATEAAAQADEGPGSPAFLGTFGVVLNDPQNKVPTPGTRDISLVLRPSARALLSRGETLEPYFVDRNDRSARKRPIRVRAASISFSRGEVDQER